MVTTNEVLDSLRPITDPEIGLDIVELGLIYGVDISEDGKKVEINLTLTSPMCPYGPEIVASAKAALSTLPDVETSNVNLVWVPRWDPRVHASEEAKAYLGIW
jgi:metal-sulfur cluster biosynthetic enzyme